MIVKVMAYAIGSVLAAGFVWFTIKVVAAGVKVVLSSGTTGKKKGGK